MKNKLECLLIDDDIDDQEIFQMALEEINPAITLTVAASCADAITALLDKATFIPDFIFIDVNMPKLNGIQCLAEIKKMDHLKDTTKVMYSTSSNHAMISASIELGADDYLVKPTKLDILIEELSKIIEKWKL